MREVDGVLIGSDNVFADLGLPDPEGLMAKAQMLRAISLAMKARKISEGGLAKLVGLKKAEVSDMLNGPRDEFPLHRLASILNALGRDVTITIRERSEGVGRTLVEAA